MGNNNQCSPTSCTPSSTSHPHSSQSYPSKSTSSLFRLNSREMADKMMNLSELSQTLKIHECFYVLSSLIQQYHSIFKRYNKAIVTIDCCFVNQLGQIKVFLENQWSNELPNEVVSNNLVSIISRILEIVKTLALQKQWEQNIENSYFHDKFLKIIYRHHQNDQVLYHELMNQVYDYIQFNQIKCNLLGAVLRLKAPIQQPLLQPPIIHKKYDSQSIKSFARQQSEFGMKNADLLSKTAFTKNYNSSKFGSNLNERYDNIENNIYHRQMAKTQGEEYYKQARVMNHERSHPNFKLNSENLPSNKNYISSQFSMHITSISNKEVQQGKARVRFKKFTQKMRYDAKQEQNNNDKALKRNNTVNNLGQKHNKSYTKSVLQDLARSVEVREEPSSKSLIF